jgi:4-carboxymuconolactone decarboxylase
MADYYNHEDLSHLEELGEDSPLLWRAFQTYLAHALADGALSRREKSLIALAVAHAIQCPYSIDAYAEDCLERGFNSVQMAEAVHVAAAIRGGASLMHGLQMRNATARLTRG